MSNFSAASKIVRASQRLEEAQVLLSEAVTAASDERLTSKIGPVLAALSQYEDDLDEIANGVTA